MTDQELHAACQQHGTDAQRDAYIVLSTYLYRTARAMLRGHPQGHQIAEEAMQNALTTIHLKLDQCEDPGAFRSWAATSVKRKVLDLLRQPWRQWVPLPDSDHDYGQPVEPPAPDPDTADELRKVLLETIRNGGLTERSQRVVLGRFFLEQTDEFLAAEETRIAQEIVRPSNIQVTRSKNMAKLRKNEALKALLRELLEQ
ncbi:MAG TPA: sigma-70 family RNA polymerase sigma factor [Roseiflexaceae bacterium]|nr:sigma-70 family RNA polymerase sigma factor [Roseiflexaceae bacterium]